MTNNDCKTFLHISTKKATSALQNMSLVSTKRDYYTQDYYLFHETQ